MFAVGRLRLVTASVILALAVTVPAAAQGKSGSAPGKNKPKKSTPPSSSSLPAVTGAAAASPLSWIDDASLLAPGAAALTISAARWSGADVSEVDVPIVDAAFGLTRRVQLSASIPHIIGSADGTGAVGGVGTSYVVGKVALLDDADLKVAVSPLLEVLGQGALQSQPAGTRRYQIGFPVSLEAARGSVRVFAATGYFTRGAWFGGGGAGFQVTPRTGASISLTRSWAKADADAVRRSRSEIAGGVSYFVSPHIAVYGSAGHTIATTDENGAGLSLGTGVSFLLNPDGNKPSPRR